MMGMHKNHILASILLVTLLLPWGVIAQDGPRAAAASALFERGVPFEQDLVITAYYSPLPGQCCYVKGSYAADMILNGEGHHAADGTAVYAGMVAAPPSYPFGTRIALPGIGTVSVHDRGGAIQEWTDAHRLDLWVGHGEEGLARALAFGVQRVRATVYPVGSAQPSASIDLARLPSPPAILRAYAGGDTTLLDLQARAGQKTASVQMLQEKLAALGFFSDTATGQYGPATQAALRSFYEDMRVEESSQELTLHGAALIEAAYARRTAADPVPLVVEPGSSAARIASAQRTMRFLGFYKGRTSGVYDESFHAAVLAFQKHAMVVASDATPGAGRIGPQTRKAIMLAWRAAHARRGANRLLALRKIDQLIAEKDYDLSTFLGRGDRGQDVRRLQNFLADRGFLGRENINGTFGAHTEQALIAYQLRRGIIAAQGDPGAGFAGPATLLHYRRDLRQSLLKVVRARGWAAI